MKQWYVKELSQLTKVTWNALLYDMCGKDIAIRSEFIDNVINHPHCTADMKVWLVKTK